MIAILGGESTVMVTVSSALNCPSLAVSFKTKVPGAVNCAVAFVCVEGVIVTLSGPLT